MGHTNKIEVVLMTKELRDHFERIFAMCTPSRDNTLTGYNVTEEFEQLEKVEVEQEWRIR